MTWLALGGCAPLVGENVSHFVYVDEAGISNAKQEPFLTVAGVIINADKKLAGVRAALDLIVSRHIPSEFRSDFVFHATELFNGTSGKDSPFDRERGIKLQDRLKIADDLARLPAKFNLPLAFGYVERSEFAKGPFMVGSSQDNLTMFAHVTAFMSCTMQVDQWARKETPNEVCLMIVEDNDRARSLIRDMQRHHQSKRVIEALPQYAKFFPLRKVIEDPHFQPKRPSSALQMADFCAYVFKRWLMGDRRYDRFMNPLWKYSVAPFSERLLAAVETNAKKQPS